MCKTLITFIEAEILMLEMRITVSFLQKLSHLDYYLQYATEDGKGYCLWHTHIESTSTSNFVKVSLTSEYYHLVGVD